MVDNKLGVEKLVDPEANAVPPEAAAYQSAVAPALTTVESEAIPLHIVLGVTLVTVGTELIVAVTAVLLDEIQPVVVFLACA